MARVFSGIQPSGELHLGNYLGAVRNWVEMQNQDECYFCIVDYHAITQQYEPEELAARTLDMAIGLLASGIDPERAVLFVQSHVAEHTELAWIFNTVTPIGELERMTQFKDKSRRQESILAGLLNYPVLQAADVLLYKAEVVPVGEDQTQHIELIREVSRKWNARYGSGFFPEPDARVTGSRRIIGLDGQAKMSKSIGNTIGVLEKPEDVWQHLRPAKTDPARVKKTDPGSPELCNVYSLHEHFSPTDTVQEVAANCRAAGWGCLDCKRVLADNISATFAPMRERAAQLAEETSHMQDVLHDGAERARKVAQDTMVEVRDRMGLLGPCAAMAGSR